MVATTIPPPVQTPERAATIQALLAERSSTRLPGTGPRSRIGTAADQANTIFPAGRADLVALARPRLTDPMFALRAAAQYGVPGVSCPVQ